MASQTEDNHFWSQLWRLLFWFWKLSHDFFTFIFWNQKYISAFIVFVSVSITFASYLNLIVCLNVFLIGKFEKIHEFNRVWASTLSPSNNFLTMVWLWYRACLQRPTYGISVFIVRSIHRPRAFSIRSIHGPRAFSIMSIHRPRVFLLRRMSGHMAYLTRSCYGFYLWRGWGQGYALVSCPWRGQPGLPYFQKKNRKLAQKCIF